MKMFDHVSEEVDSILLSFTEFYRVLPCFTVFYRTRVGLTQIYNSLPSFTEINSFTTHTHKPNFKKRKKKKRSLRLPGPQRSVSR